MSSRPTKTQPPDDALGERAPAPVVLRGNDVSCRAQHWSFQPRTAHLVLFHQQRLPSLADFQRWSERLVALGYTKVRTTALGTAAGLRVETAGFRPIQELVLLEHTHPRTPGGERTSTAPTYRLLEAQHPAASAVDVAAFGNEWALEPRAVSDVCSATPRHRVRAAGTPLAAYAITGRDAKQGFLQRLAVAPEHQRLGLGRALAVDSLQWLARWRVQRVLVNTPTDNFGALALYEQLGFRRLAERLRVYELVLA